MGQLDPQAHKAVGKQAVTSSRLPQDSAARHPEVSRRFEQPLPTAFGTRLPWALMIVTSGVILYHSWLVRSYTLDDALIYARYFRNFFEGHGLVYNHGVRFNGLTSPLYAYVTLAVGWIFPSPLSAAWTISTLSMILCAWLAFLYGKGRGHALGYAIGLLIGFSLPYFYLTYGMETGLFLALIAICLYLFERANYGLLASASALLIITRVEGVFLLVALAAQHLVRQRRWPSPLVLIAPTLILAAHYTFNRLYYGAWLPGTGMAKIWQGRSGLWGTDAPLFLHASYLYSMVFFRSPWMLVIAVVLALLGAARHLQHTYPLIVFASLYTSFYCVLNVPPYHWYYAPLLLIFFIHAGLGVAVVMRQCARFYPRTVAAPIVAGMASLAVIALIGYTAPRGGVAPDPRSTSYHKAGLWIDQNLPPQSSISAVEIGILGYYSKRRIIDILGLVNPDNARFIGEGRFDAWLTEYHPDYFLVHNPTWAQETSVGQLVQEQRVWVRPDFAIRGLTLYCQPHEPGCVPITNTR